ncbi:MAG: hypothetical protein ACXABK_06985 [Candidatus Heimdallarchaeaceae archaeon]
MEQTIIRKRILFDLLGILIGASLTYVSSIFVFEVTDISQWSMMIAAGATSLASGFLIGFFAYKRDGILLSSIAGGTMLGILIFFGLSGKRGIYEAGGTLSDHLIFYIAAGVAIFFLEIIGSFFGRLATPKLWKQVKGEIIEEEHEEIVKESPKETYKEAIPSPVKISTLTKPCPRCGAGVPSDSERCPRCGETGRL